MRTYSIRHLPEDRRKAAGRQAFGFGHRAERRMAEIHDHRLSTQTERVGSSLIMVTCFE